MQRKASLELFEQFCENLIKFNWNISKACECIDISRTAYYEWMSQEAVFKKMVDEANEKRGDLIEARAIEIARGHTDEPSNNMAQFLLKTKYRNRGYKEVQELSVEGGLNFTMPEGFEKGDKKPDDEVDK